MRHDAKRLGLYSLPGEKEQVRVAAPDWAYEMP